MLGVPRLSVSFVLVVLYTYTYYSSRPSAYTCIAYIDDLRHLTITVLATHYP